MITILHLAVCFVFFFYYYSSLVALRFVFFFIKYIFDKVFILKNI